MLLFYTADACSSSEMQSYIITIISSIALKYIAIKAPIFVSGPSSYTT